MNCPDLNGGFVQFRGRTFTKLKRTNHEITRSKKTNAHETKPKAGQEGWLAPAVAGQSDS